MHGVNDIEKEPVVDGYVYVENFRLCGIVLRIVMRECFITSEAQVDKIL
jgi:hypothetical protein